MYGIKAGQLDTLVAFTRRAQVDVRTDGAFAPLLTTWAQVVQASGRQQLQAGTDVSFVPATLRVRDSTSARGIVAGDRARFGGRDHRVTSVSVPLRTGVIEVAVTTDLGET